jgi:hypothetical protein
MRSIHKHEAKREMGGTRRELGRAVGFLPALGLLVGGVLGALVACTPVRGYPGLERPKEEVALVTVASGHINRAVTDGREFGAAGISLLPGNHRFELSASHGERPYDCRPYTIVDTYGFDRCQKERQADIRKGKKDPRDCWLSTYTQHRKTCLRDYRDAACEVTLALLPGRTYELEVPPPVSEPPIVVASLVSGSFFNKERVGLGISGTCRFVRLYTQQEDYEATWW